MKVYTDYVPKNTLYLTPGKRYEIVKDSNDTGWMYNDDGHSIYLYIPNCAHLDGNAWSVEE